MCDAGLRKMAQTPHSLGLAGREIAREGVGTRRGLENVPDGECQATAAQHESENYLNGV